MGGVNTENVAYAYQAVLFSLKKEEHPAIFDNKNESVEYYAKPGAEGQKLRDPTSMRNLKWSDSERQGVEQWRPGAGGRGQWGGLRPRHKVAHLCKMKS